MSTETFAHELGTFLNAPGHLMDAFGVIPEHLKTETIETIDESTIGIFTILEDLNIPPETTRAFATCFFFLQKDIVYRDVSLIDAFPNIARLFRYLESLRGVTSAKKLLGDRAVLPIPTVTEATSPYREFLRRSNTPDDVIDLTMFLLDIGVNIKTTHEILVAGDPYDADYSHHRAKALVDAAVVFEKLRNRVENVTEASNLVLATYLSSLFTQYGRAPEASNLKATLVELGLDGNAISLTLALVQAGVGLKRLSDKFSDRKLAGLEPSNPQYTDILSKEQAAFVECQTHALTTAITVYIELGQDTTIANLAELTAASYLSAFFIEFWTGEYTRPLLESMIERYQLLRLKADSPETSGRELIQIFFGEFLTDVLYGEAQRLLSQEDLETLNSSLAKAVNLQSLETAFHNAGVPFEPYAEAATIRAALTTQEVDEETLDITMLLIFIRSYMENSDDAQHIPKVREAPYIPYSLLLRLIANAGRISFNILARYDSNRLRHLNREAVREHRYTDNPLLAQAILILSLESHERIKRLKQNCSPYDENPYYSKGLTSENHFTEIEDESRIPGNDRLIPEPCTARNCLASALLVYDFWFNGVTQQLPIPQLIAKLYDDVSILLHPKAIATLLHFGWRDVLSIEGSVDWEEYFQRLDIAVAYVTGQITYGINKFWKSRTPAETQRMQETGTIGNGYNFKEPLVILLEDRGRKGPIPTLHKCWGGDELRRPHDTTPRPLLTARKALELIQDFPKEGNVNYLIRESSYTGKWLGDLYTVAAELAEGISFIDRRGKIAPWINPMLAHLDRLIIQIPPQLQGIFGCTQVKLNVISPDTKNFRQDFQLFQVGIVPETLSPFSDSSAIKFPPLEFRIYPRKLSEEIRTSHLRYKRFPELMLVRVAPLTQQLITQLRNGGELTVSSSDIQKVNNLKVVIQINNERKGEASPVEFEVDTRNTPISAKPQYPNASFLCMLTGTQMRPIVDTFLSYNPPLKTMISGPNKNGEFKILTFKEYERQMAGWLRGRENTARTAFRAIGVIKPTDGEIKELAALLAARYKTEAADYLTPAGRRFIFDHLESQNYTSIEITTAVLAAAFLKNSDLARMVKLKTFENPHLTKIRTKVQEQLELFLEGHVQISFFAALENDPEMRSYLLHLRRAKIRPS